MILGPSQCGPIQLGSLPSRPWSLEYAQINGCDCCRRVVDEDGNIIVDAPDFVTARLIAMAPALLEAADGMLAVLTDIVEGCVMCGGGENSCEFCAGSCAAITVYKKAKGDK